MFIHFSLHIFLLILFFLFRLLFFGWAGSNLVLDYWGDDNKCIQLCRIEFHASGLILLIAYF